jgi:sec-independent protein translocase protein TatA
MLPIIGLFSSIGPWELIIIGAVALVLFGKRLPEVGRSLGRGIVEFKKGLKGLEEEVGEAGDKEKDESKDKEKKK